MVGGVVYSRAGYVRDDLCLRTLHLRKELAAVVTFSEMTCSCGVVFMLSDAFIKIRRDDHKTFYCPNGCTRFYPQDNVEEKLRKIIKAKEAQILSVEDTNKHLRERYERTERSRRTYKGLLTRCKRGKR
jgi:hypothetical protein